MFALKTPVALALFGVLLLLPKQSATQKQENKAAVARTSDVLKDTDSYRVYVLFDGDKPDTFTVDDVRVDVELKLRQNGIHVLTNEEYNVKPLSSRLVVDVGITKYKDRLFSSFACTLEVSETMQSIRNPKMFVIGASTWQQTRFGIVGVDKMNFVRDTVKELTDKFLNDYLAANPKK